MARFRLCALAALSFVLAQGCSWQAKQTANERSSASSADGTGAKNKTNVSMRFKLPDGMVRAHKLGAGLSLHKDHSSLGDSNVEVIDEPLLPQDPSIQINCIDDQFYDQASKKSALKHGVNYYWNEEIWAAPTLVLSRRDEFPNVENGVTGSGVAGLTFPFFCSGDETISIAGLQIGEQFTLDAQLLDENGVTTYAGSTGRFEIRAGDNRASLVMSRSDGTASATIDVVFSDSSEIAPVKENYPMPTELASKVDSFKCDGSEKNHQFKADRKTQIVSVTQNGMGGTSTLDLFGDGTVKATNTPSGGNNGSSAKTKKLSNAELQAFLSDFIDKTCLLSIDASKVAEKVKIIDSAVEAACGPNCAFGRSTTSDCDGPQIVINIDGIHYDQTFNTCNDFSTIDPVHTELAERAFVSNAHNAVFALIDSVLK